MTTEIKREKRCCKCKETKPTSDFYWYQGKPRSECKICIIARQVAYQKRTEYWKHRYGDAETRKSKARQYYAENRDKFRGYRQAFKDKQERLYRESKSKSTD